MISLKATPRTPGSDRHEPPTDFMVTLRPKRTLRAGLKVLLRTAAPFPSRRRAEGRYHFFGDDGTSRGHRYANSSSCHSKKTANRPAPLPGLRATHAARVH